MEGFRTGASVGLAISAMLERGRRPLASSMVGSARLYCVEWFRGTRSAVLVARHALRQSTPLTCEVVFYTQTAWLGADIAGILCSVCC